MPKRKTRASGSDTPLTGGGSVHMKSFTPTSHRSGKSAKRKRKSGESEGEKAESVKDLCQFAEQAMAQMNIVQAVQFYLQAIDMEPVNPILHHRLGVALTEGAQTVLAHNAFATSIDLLESDLPSNYLYIAQQCAGFDSLRAYQNAITIMDDELERRAQLMSDALGPSPPTTTATKKGSSTEDNRRPMLLGQFEEETAEELVKNIPSEELRKEIGRAHCSIGELYMTDLCEEDDAQECCERSLHTAVQICPENIECQCTLGEFHLLFKRFAESTACFDTAFSHLFQVSSSSSSSQSKAGSEDCEMKGIGASAVSRESEEISQEEEDAELAAFLKDNDAETDAEIRVDIDSDMTVDSLLKMVKLGVEIDNRFAECLKISRLILRSDENLPEAWALCALCHYKLGDMAEATLCLENAKCMAEEIFKDSGGKSVWLCSDERGDDTAGMPPMDDEEEDEDQLYAANIELKNLIEDVMGEMDITKLCDLAELEAQMDRMNLGIGSDEMFGKDETEEIEFDLDDIEERPAESGDVHRTCDKDIVSFMCEDS